MKKENAAIIPARGGSKGLSRKNVRKLDGIPLIAYSIRAALGSREVSRTIVTTEDEEIAGISRGFGSEVLMRPPSLASDDTPMADVVAHCLDELESTQGYVPGAFVLLQPTSPLRESRHIDAAFDILDQRGCEAVIGVFEPSSHPLKSLRLGEDGFLTGLVTDEFCFRPRQSLPAAYSINGAIFIARTSSFVRCKSLLPPKTLPYVMREAESIDIDSLEDLQSAESLIRSHRQ